MSKTYRRQPITPREWKSKEYVQLRDNVNLRREEYEMEIEDDLARDTLQRESSEARKENDFPMWGFK